MFNIIDPIDDHKTCRVKKYSLSLTPLPTVTEIKLTPNSATANLHTLLKTLTLTHSGIDKSKYVTSKIYSNHLKILK